jgi:hypothetical protein
MYVRPIKRLATTRPCNPTRAQPRRHTCPPTRPIVASKFRLGIVWAVPPCTHPWLHSEVCHRQPMAPACSHRSPTVPSATGMLLPKVACVTAPAHHHPPHRQHTTWTPHVREHPPTHPPTVLRTTHHGQRWSTTQRRGQSRRHAAARIMTPADRPGSDSSMQGGVGLPANFAWVPARARTCSLHLPAAQ